MPIKRRTLIRGAAAGGLLSATGLAAPALAQGARIRIR